MIAKFYILQFNQPSAVLSFTCKLLKNLFRHDGLFDVLTQSKEQMHELDALLWTFEDISFLPHAMIETNATQITPIRLTDQLNLVSPKSVLLNLAPNVEATCLTNKSIIEIVPNVPAYQTAARERYRCYRQKNYTLENFNINHNENSHDHH